MKDLEDHWTNVHKNTEEFGFWRHEWEKHGTCAMDNGRLDTEFKYFRTGVELNERYPLSDYLRAANVTPGGSYTFGQIYDAVRAGLGGRANPAVQCEYDRDARTHVLSQIDVCLDKRLRIMDCDQIHGGTNHGCPSGDGQRILYPDRKMVASGGKLWISKFFFFFSSFFNIIPTGLLNLRA